MMNEYDVKRLGLTLAIQAEIEGMKSENTLRAQYDGQVPSYAQHHFDEKAEELRVLAYKHNEQL